MYGLRSATVFADMADLFVDSAEFLVDLAELYNNPDGLVVDLAKVTR